MFPEIFQKTTPAGRLADRSRPNNSPAGRGREHPRLGIGKSLLQISRKNRRGKPLRSAPCKRYFCNAHSDSGSDSKSLVFGEKSKGGPLKTRIVAIFQIRKSTENPEISKIGRKKCSHVPMFPEIFQKTSPAGRRAARPRSMSRPAGRGSERPGFWLLSSDKLCRAP